MKIHQAYFLLLLAACSSGKSGEEAGAEAKGGEASVEALADTRPASPDELAAAEARGRAAALDEAEALARAQEAERLRALEQARQRAVVAQGFSNLRAKDLTSLRDQLDADLSPDARSEAGETLLTLAVERGDRILVRQLLDSGAAADLPDSQGRTALTLAIDAHDTELVRLLAARGANVDHPDSSGNTPLMRTVTHDDARVAQVLLEAGADTEPLDASGSSLAELARAQGNRELVFLLEAARARQPKD